METNTHEIRIRQECVVERIRIHSGIREQIVKHTSNQNRCLVGPSELKSFLLDGRTLQDGLIGTNEAFFW